ncbi:MAG: hydantoinase/oxoprolinase family protein [Actinomycetia bacterium]|nr:hydantoinase/oxoprolinase family protein [Actinomycetes bacterium]
MATRVGVDVGGTFTDLIFFDDATGETLVAKEPTTPEAPEQGVIRAFETGVPSEQRRTVQFFLHGTTVGLNALLERKGAVVGLLATAGFRDILEVKRGDRDDPYDLFCNHPPPLVPRRLRLPVTERMLATGEIRTPIDEDDVRHALQTFLEEGVTTVAVAFMNAYRNPAHELAAERVLREEGFDGAISLSHQVSGEYREYERTCTTVIDAFVRPCMASYLERLSVRLNDTGFDGSMLVTRCGGGSLTFEEAEARPFETILSGPVAGAEGAAELARRLELGDVVTADVGGTSFDTSVITDGRPRVVNEGRVVGLPVQTPWVDVRSIGAGGGSIVEVDIGGLLRVGPRSAGADPGPAAYDRGGRQPTVTDAALVLGMLGDGKLAGELALDADRARAALATVAEPLSFTVEQAAQGALTVVTSNMANAIREITVEQGQDPRQGRLMAFGGAGPLFGTLLARELDITRIVIPPHAGNFSAWGLLGADLTRTAARTHILQLTAESLAIAGGILDELFDDLAARNGAAEATREVGLDMRYAGQEHTLTIALGTPRASLVGVGAEAVAETFTDEYERTFGHAMEEAIEIVSARATLRTPLPRRAERFTVTSATDADVGSFRAYSFASGRWLDFELVQRATLAVGTELAGPAIVLEDTATTYVDAGFSLRVDGSGCLFMRDSHEAGPN